MSRVLSPYIQSGYALLLYVPLMVAGFYISYFAVFFTPKPALMHIHFALMVIWMAMVIAQPFLIKNKKTHWHRWVGKASYVVLPLVLWSGWAMLRMGYMNYINSLSVQIENGLTKFTQQQILHEGAIYILLGFVYIVWLATLYLLAIVNRKKTATHARYMLAAALTLTGPIVDRIFFSLLGIMKVGALPAETISFFLIDLVLGLLLIYDYKKGNQTQPLMIALIIYMTGQAFYFIAKESIAWDNFATWIMQPGT
jgi:hypothetical protein